MSTKTPVLNEYLSSVPRSGTRFTPRSPRTDSTVSRPADDERRLLLSTFSNGVCVSVSQGGNLSHVTPNTSLGFVQATPSRVLPSPTVNTREALGELSRRRRPHRLSSFTSCLPACSHSQLFWFLYHADVIMDMFQAPTLLEDPFDNTAVHAAASEAERAPAEHSECAGCSDC